MSECGGRCCVQICGAISFDRDSIPNVHSLLSCPKHSTLSVIETPCLHTRTMPPPPSDLTLTPATALQLSRSRRDEKTGLVLFILVAVLWALYGVYTVVDANLRQQRRTREAETETERGREGAVLEGVDAGTCVAADVDAGSYVDAGAGAGTETGEAEGEWIEMGRLDLCPDLGLAKDGRRGPDWFREFDDRWFRA